VYLLLLVTFKLNSKATGFQTSVYMKFFFLFWYEELALEVSPSILDTPCMYYFLFFYVWKHSLLYVPHTLTQENFVFCLYRIFMCSSPFAVNRNYYH